MFHLKLRPTERGSRVPLLPPCLHAAAVALLPVSRCFSCVIGYLSLKLGFKNKSGCIGQAQERDKSCYKSAHLAKERVREELDREKLAAIPQNNGAVSKKHHLHLYS